jgi:NitT/TauT family transport system substrate-binding protein
VAKIRIMFSRFSAFYSPLIATAAAGFLKAEGLEAEFAVATPKTPPRAGLAEGALDLIQSAVSASFAPLERGERSDLVHFAQINQ